MSKVTCRDFIFFSDQAAPQWEKVIAKLLVVLEFLPWALRGILLFGARVQTGWVQGFDGSR